MKKILFCVLFTAACVSGFAQNDSAKRANDGEDYYKIFTRVEKEAQFPGGAEGWKKYLDANLNADLGNKYIPLKKSEKMAQQMVKVQFLVDKEGKLSDVKAVDSKGVHPKLAQEAVRVIKAGPDWIPAEQNGRKVVYQAIQYITFQVGW